MRHLRALLSIALLPVLGCGYAFYAGPMRPLETQGGNMEVQDDGGVRFSRDRLEIRVRPITDDELNRRFQTESDDGRKSTNPYTYGNTERPKQESGGRFTVFQVSVKNYEYPKVLIDPAKVSLITDNGREYWALSGLQLTNYFRAYVQGYGGNEYARFRERQDLLRRTMFPKEMIFSGQELVGFLVFQSLNPDVAQLTLKIHQAVTRFDYRDEPVEAIDISYRFGRDIGRVNRDGSRETEASAS
ncbi:MAG TPA: hypothetical protein EYO90_05640 [Candidatus Latescibacteria bacterium]|nr:hypothetical protein [Candidatus Latescibacterota bacterium]